MALDKTFNILFRFFLPKVKDVMTGDFPILDSETPVIEAFKMATNDNINTIIVTEKGNPAGVLTRRDLIGRCFFQQVDCNERTVKEFMSQPIISIDVDEDIIQAYDKMSQNKIRRLIVLEKTRIAGVITLDDIKHLSTAVPGATVYRLGYFLMGVLVTLTAMAIILL